MVDGTDREGIGGGGCYTEYNADGTMPSRGPRRLSASPSGGPLSPIEFALTWVLALTGLVSPQGAPPRVGGIALGSTGAEVVRVLGRPDREDESLGIRFWDYKARALTLMWHEGEPGLQGFVVRGRGSGAMDGVRIGDTVRVLDLAWGTPSRVRQDGRFRDFAHADWVVSAEIAKGRVVSLTVLRVRAPD